jgi:hypothetical protein
MIKYINLFLYVFIGLFLLSCASTTTNTTPPTIFIPHEGTRISSFYRNGLPIGTIDEGSSFIMVSMENVSVAGNEYMRPWFLCKNKSSNSFLLEPLKAVNLKIIVGKQLRYTPIFPESSTKILAHIENEKAKSLILQAIGGA